MYLNFLSERLNAGAEFAGTVVGSAVGSAIKSAAK
jgi:hypothetical protein